jgi:signal transduction histidine kinase/DNA-binding response OmpR family regulator
MRLALAGALTLLCALPVKGQAVLPHRHYGLQHGLPSEHIEVVTQTPDGRLWIGTLNGVAFFDGFRFRRIRADERFSFARVIDLIPADRNSVWVAAAGSGLWRVNSSGAVQEVPGLSGQTVNRLSMQGDTLLAVTRSSLWILEPEARDAVEHPFGYSLSPPAQARRQGDHIGSGARQVVQAGDRAYWVLDVRLGPGLWTRDGPPRFLAETVDEWISMLQDEEGVLWALSTRRGLFRVDSREMRLERTLPVQGASGLYLENGILHVMTAEGEVLHWDTVSPGLLPPPPLRWPATRMSPGAIHRDHEGGLWLGSRIGLFYTPSGGIRQVAEISGKRMVSPHYYTDAAAGNKWVASWGTGLVDIQQNRIVTPSSQRYWAGLLQSRDGNVYAMASSGRYVLKGGSWERIADDYGAIRGSVDAGGVAYLWTDSGMYVQTQGSEPQLAYAWHPDRRDYHTFTLASDGHLIFRANDVIYQGQFDEKTGLQLDTLAVVTELRDVRGRFVVADRKGQLWFGLWHDGLLLVANGEARTLLSEIYVLTVNVPEPGLVVVSTRQGILGFDVENASLLFHLTTDDGLLASTAHGVLFRDEHLVVTHPTGLSLVPRSALEQKLPPPGVILEVDQFDPRDRSLRVQFFVPTFRSPDQIRYEYRINDEPWRSTEQTSLLLTALPSGRHVVSVRARWPFGEFGQETTHSFEIPAPWYLKPWFLALVLFLIVSVAVGAHRYRMAMALRLQRRLEESVRERTMELRQSNERAEDQARQLAELDEARSRFFADISHELRTPLSIIMASLEEVRLDDALPDGERARLDPPMASAGRLMHLIDEILALSRLRSGHVRLALVPTDLARLLQERVSVMSALAEERQIDLALDIPEKPALALIDIEAITRVFDNLLVNAVKFTPEGGIVSSSVTIEHSDVVARIRDTGPGIPPEALPNVFDRYYRAADGPQAPAGTGIGLALCRELILLHGGSVHVESDPGEGAEFILRLGLYEMPMVAGEQVEGDGLPAGDADSLTLMEPSPVSKNEDRSHILLVEDNQALRGYLTELLAREFRVSVASSGEEALRYLDREIPDVVVSDVMMPGMDGLTLCRRIKSQPRLEAIPVILLTARTAAEQVIEGLEAGAAEYIRKPFNIAELTARIRRNVIRVAEVGGRKRMSLFLGSVNNSAVSEDEAFLERVYMLLEERHTDPGLSVKEMALELGIGPRQLRRRLLECTSMTTNQFLRTFRLERAGRLLATGSWTISEIAFAVGFNDVRVFRRHFRDHFGSLPSEYAEEMEGKA